MLSLDSELVRAGIRLFCCILGEIHRGPGARPSLLYPCAERRRIPPSRAVPLMRIGTQILVIIEKLASNFLVIVKIFYGMKAAKNRIRGVGASVREAICRVTQRRDGG